MGQVSRSSIEHEQMEGQDLDHWQRIRLNGSTVGLTMSIVTPGFPESKSSTPSERRQSKATSGPNTEPISIGSQHLESELTTHEDFRNDVAPTGLSQMAGDIQSGKVGLGPPSVVPQTSLGSKQCVDLSSYR